MKKILPIMLALVIALTAVGCSASKTEDTKTTTAPASETKEAAEVKTLKAEKTGSIDKTNLSFGKGGAYYSEGSKYGIISADGQSDTGAVYNYCKDEENYFMVTKSTTKKEDISSLNCFGLVNDKGEEIIPEKYASIDVLNEYYAVVIEVTEKTTSDDDALLFINNSDNFIKIFPDENDTKLKGNWYLYNLKTKKQIGNITGTKNYTKSASDKLFTYYNDDKKQIYINPEGAEIPDSATVFGDDYYYIVNDSGYEFYDLDGNKLFNLDANYLVMGFAATDELFAARDREAETGDKDVYVVMNISGEAVSSKFEVESDFKIVNSEFVIADKKLCDYKGNAILEGDFSYGETEDEFNRAICLTADDEDYSTVIIDSKGNILFDGREEKDAKCIFTETAFSVRVNGSGADDNYYNFKTKKFDIEGSSPYKWLVKTKADADNKSNLIDSFTGETLISSYSDYQFAGSIKTNLYVYAKTDSGYDIFSIS